MDNHEVDYYDSEVEYAYDDDELEYDSEFDNDGVSGNWESILQTSFENTDLIGLQFSNDQIWNVTTGLQGLDFLVNKFVTLQFSVLVTFGLKGFSFMFFSLSVCLTYSFYHLRHKKHALSISHSLISPLSHSLALNMWSYFR